MTFEDYEIDKVVGLDIEPADKDVGIMDESFCLMLKTIKGKQLQLYFNTDGVYNLVAALKPIIDDIKFHEETDKLLEEEHKNDKN